MPELSQQIRKKPVALSIKKCRNAYCFSTQEANVHLVRYNGKPAVLRLLKPRYSAQPSSSMKMDAANNFAMQSIFHIIFPRYSIHPLSVMSVSSKFGKRWGMVSEVVKARSADYKAFQQGFYGLEQHRNSPAYKRHEDFVKKIAVPISGEIYKKTGIVVNDYPVNVCNVKGKPIFFEIDGINPKKLKEYVDSQNFDPKTKETLSALLKFKELF